MVSISIGSGAVDSFGLSGMSIDVVLFEKVEGGLRGKVIKYSEQDQDTYQVIAAADEPLQDAFEALGLAFKQPLQPQPSWEQFSAENSGDSRYNGSSCYFTYRVKKGLSN